MAGKIKELKFKNNMTKKEAQDMLEELEKPEGVIFINNVRRSWNGQPETIKVIQDTIKAMHGLK